MFRNLSCWPPSAFAIFHMCVYCSCLKFLDARVTHEISPIALKSIFYEPPHRLLYLHRTACHWVHVICTDSLWLSRERSVAPFNTRLLSTLQLRSSVINSPSQWESLMPWSTRARTRSLTKRSALHEIVFTFRSPSNSRTYTYESNQMPPSDTFRLYLIEL